MTSDTEDQLNADRDKDLDKLRGKITSAVFECVLGNIWEVVPLSLKIDEIMQHIRDSNIMDTEYEKFFDSLNDPDAE